MLSKECKNCKKIIYKKQNCSIKDWNNRVAYCSHKCSDTFRRGKPFFNSGSFKKGHKLFENDIRKKRYGFENNLWKGGKIELTCKICQKIYEVELYRAEKSKFCSAICRKEYEKSPENRFSMSKIHRERVALGLHNLYRGITELKALLRQTSQYKQWRMSVFMRDNFQCLFCGASGEMNADHIKPFAVIIVENNLKTLDDAINCEELWNVKNGRTLCVSCHRKTETYGRFAPAFISKKITNIKYG